ncbi:MAG: glycosyltransferase family 2 protein [Planctomycetota bacterium]|nr:glycosyltransferase family 2 protein [Planctomycetota bacterium]
MNAADVRPTITAAIITLNEERNLGALLPRLAWVDEVLVVDGGSSDDTLAVAHRHGCRVVERRFDSFARQRNHAISLATCDWVLSLDADEIPSPLLAAEIVERICSPRQAAYRLPIRSTILGSPLRRSGTQDDRPVRLFRVASARWVGDVHERLRIDGRVGTLRNWLSHSTQSTLDVFLSKMHRYTTLEARSRVAAGMAPGRLDAWLAPPREIFRRLIYKQGILDGPAGWKFCLLSGLYEWVLADRHRRSWRDMRIRLCRKNITTASRRPGYNPPMKPETEA